MLNIFKKLLSALTKTKWTDHDQLRHLEYIINEDKAWLGHHCIARALIDRYLQALRDNWYAIDFESQDDLCRRLCINTSGKVNSNKKIILDGDINLANILYEGLNNQQKRTFITGMRVSFDLSNSDLAQLLGIDRSDILKLFVEDDVNE